MEQQHLALAYCIDNIQLAEQIAQELKSVGHAPQHYYGSKSSPDKPLFEQLKSHSGPILILVTDNFLRSAQCMAGGREFMQDNRDVVLPIVAAGSRQDESRNTYLVSTQFERISDIIQYINYWQDQYLDLRRQKRELEHEIDETTFNEHLRRVRAISGETSEFLRLLRSAEYLTQDEVEETHYEPVFRFIGDMKAWETLKKARVSRVMENVPVIAGMDNESPEAVELPEEPPVALADIPGISLLPDDEDEIVFEEEVVPEQPEIADAIDLPTSEDIPVDLAISEEILQEEEEEEVINADAILENITEWVSGGQTEKAIEQLRLGLEQKPAHIDMRYQLAHLLVKHEDNFEEARQQLGILLKHESKHTDALFLCGELSEIEEDFDEAAGFYQDVAAIDTNYPEVHYRLGLLLAHQFEDTQEHAVAEFVQAIAQDADNGDAHYQYGMLLNEHHNAPEAAAVEFSETLRLQPKHPFAYYDLALIYHAQGEMEKAKMAYQNAVKLNPEVETPENDIAFGVSQAPIEEPVTVEVPIIASVEPEEEPSNTIEDHTETQSLMNNTTTTVNEIELNALAALKENINRLEEMIQTRDEEQQKKKEERPGNGITVMITGATSGIGKATADLFAKNGFRVILTGRRKDRLRDLKKTFKAEHDTDIHTLNFDVRNVEEVKKAIGKLPKTWKNIDILINNAGKAKGFDPIHEGHLEHWEEMIDTNLKGLLYLTRAVTPHMVERRHGHIINISSSAGKEVYANGNVYCATKHAVDALTKAMRLDLHTFNIRVSQVAPAHVEETEFAEVRFDGDKERGAKVYEDFQPLTSPDVAEAIYFIATRPAHVNVQDIFILGTQQASSTVIDRSGR